MSYKNTLALIGADAPTNLISALEREGFRAVVMPNDTRLPVPVSSHADMLLFPLEDKIFISKGYAGVCLDELKIIKDYGYTVVLCDGEPRNEYPYDILFNIALVGNNAIGNLRYADRTVMEYLIKNQYSTHTVKQGYAKCSSVILGDKAVISADSGILSAARAIGVDTLHIENSPTVSLEGYDYGFLGGACGYFDTTLYFCGDISLHPEYEQMSSFCEKHGISLCSLCENQLYDVGGIFFLKRIN